LLPSGDRVRFHLLGERQSRRVFGFAAFLQLPQQLRQLGDIRRDPARLDGLDSNVGARANQCREIGFEGFRRPRARLIEPRDGRR
jgi:hypothetical protein